MLLLSAGAPPAERDEAQPVRVVREIVVKRQVVRDETVVPSSATGAVADAEAPAPDPSAAAPVVSRTDGVPDSTAARRPATSDRAPTRQADRSAGSVAAGGQTTTPPEAETAAPIPDAPAAEPETSASPTPPPPVDGDAATAATEPPAAG